MTMTDEMTETRQPLLHVSTGPHLRQAESVPTIMLSVLCALVPALAAAVILFGMHALSLIVTCALAAAGTEALACFAFRKPQTVVDFSAVVTGTLLACTLPPNCPLWVGALGSMFAIGVIKLPFGGLGHSIVNPALAARAFLLISYPAAMTAYCAPLHGTLSGLSKGLDGISSATPLSYFKMAMASGTFNALDLQDALPNFFWGNAGGSLGATSAAALIVGAIFLFYKGIIRFRISFSFIGTVFFMFWLFNRTGAFFTTEAFVVPTYHVLSGGVLIGAFFMATDPVTSPVTRRGMIIFGVGCGLLTFGLRSFGGYPEGVGFAILLMNLCVPIIDRISRPRRFGEVKKRD
jgi:Na+-translocating ferredoxin:NAD+ oxidoreductase subunit D